MTPDPALKRAAEITLLGLVVWREARGEPLECRRAVASSVLNRVMRPAWWGKDLLSVIRKKWQYSSFTDPRDPQLVNWPATEDSSWWECLEVAADVIDGRAVHPAPGADSYYDISIPAPSWAPQSRFVRQIGRVRFYDVDRDFERQAVA